MTAAENFQEQDMGENCPKNCHEKCQSKVDFFIHENAMMHKDVDNERLNETMKHVSNNDRKSKIAMCITFVAIIVIFVTAYTIRTSIWLETVNKMIDRIVEISTGHVPTGAEVDDAVHQQPDQ